MSNHSAMFSLPVPHNPIWAIVPYGIIPYDACYMKNVTEVIIDNIAQHNTVTSYWTGKVGLSNPIGIIRLGYEAICPDGNICGVQEPCRDLDRATSILGMLNFATCKGIFKNYLI